VYSPAKDFASSTSTVRRRSKSLLFPTNMAMTLAEVIPASVWTFNSFNHRVLLAYVAHSFI
jgi:hypothetical protein